MLRGVNVGGKTLKMDEVRKMFQSMGYKEVRTYIQSGNILFESGEDSDLSQLEREIEKHLAEVIRLEGISVILRTASQMRKAVKCNPFLEKDHSKLHVTFLRDKPSNIPLEEIKLARRSQEDFAIKGGEVYLYCPNGYGVTKLSNSFFEKKLNTVATTRNWRTVNAFLEMCN